MIPYVTRGIHFPQLYYVSLGQTSNLDNLVIPTELPLRESYCHYSISGCAFHHLNSNQKKNIVNILIFNHEIVALSSEAAVTHI